MSEQTEEILNKFLALPEKDRDELILILVPWTNIKIAENPLEKYNHPCECCGTETLAVHLNSDLECAKCAKERKTN